MKVEINEGAHRVTAISVTDLVEQLMKLPQTALVALNERDSCLDVLEKLEHGQYMRGQQVLFDRRR